MSYFKNLLITVLLVFVYSQFEVYAQPSGQKSGSGSNGSKEGYGVITGTLNDAVSDERVEYGNIILLKSSDNKMVTGTITDSKGRFLLEKVLPGTYNIRIQFIGYENKIIPDLTVSAQNANIKLGVIKIEPKASSLSAVEIKSDKAMITSNLDKKVITVDKSMAIGGGTATDVMENVPSVSVDADGNVSLRGNPNITLLVDGKPSTQAGLAASDVLNQIPASAIESVEVITNPSVKYDPDGTSGIINIVLKKKALQGFNGMVSGNVGTGDKYNGSLNMNYRQDKFNVFIGADGRMNHMKTSAENTRTSTYSDVVNLLKQKQKGTLDRNMNSLSGGIDYFINTRNSLTLSIQHRNLAFDSHGTMYNSNYDRNDSLFSYFERHTDNTREVKSYDYTASYKHQFSQKGREYTNDIIFSSNEMKNGSDISQQDLLAQSYNPDGTPLLQQNIARNTNKALTLQGNYIYPMKDEGRIEAGYKAAIRDMAMRYDYSNYNDSTANWINREDLKNHYDYTDQLYAVYGLYGNSIGDFKYQAGLRFEQVWTRSKVVLTNTDYNSSYSGVYPSLHTQYDLGKETELQFSYSRRVERPSPRELNPYIDYSDSLNIETGNPALKPEFANSFELGIEKFWKGSSANVNLFYEHTKDGVEDISRLLDGGVTMTMPMNISSSTKYGTEFTGSANPVKWMKINANVSLFRDVLNAIPAENIPGSAKFSWSSRLNISIIPWKDGSFQVIANYNSPTREIQEYHKEQYYADASFRQDFCKNKLSATLRLTDVFNTRTFFENTYGNGFTSESKRYRESRVFYAGIQLKINNYNKKPARESSNGDNSEQDGF
jgi:outer membrane receptor protein involved in Fe transport